MSPGSWVPRRARRPTSTLGVGLLVLSSVYALGPPGAAGTAVTPGGLGALPLAPNVVNTSLTLNTSFVNLSAQFWGTTVNNEVRMFRGEPDSVNATPAKVLVWPGAMAGEDYDPLTNTHYDTYTGAPVHALTSEAQFVRMCKAIRCIAIMQVPAEIDNPSLAEAIVNYTEVNLSFVPSYWMIGNEPELWSHWKVPWKDWATTYGGGPTPTQFGNEVLAYVQAIRNVDNSTPILGLPASGCTCGSWTFAQWIAGVLKVTGTKIQAVAFHEYPAGWLGTGDGSLRDFYGTLQGPASIPVRMLAARQAVTSTCGSCNVSVFISELGSALSWSAYGQYAIGFSGSLSLASQITQAMAVNLTNVDLFATELATTNSWFSPQGHARPDYGLYTQVLDHLGSQAYSASLPGLGRTLYGIATVAPDDQGRQDLLVMNDNITTAIRFTPQFGGGGGSAPVESWSWNGSIHTSSNGTTWVEPYTANPVPQPFPDGLPSEYVLPPQSLALFESYPSGGTYVRVGAQGVPAGTPWYASVGSRFYTTTGENLSLLLANGTYPIGSVGVPLPLGGRELNPSERLGPVPPAPLNVSGAYANTSIRFVDQWRVNLTPSPSVGGTVTPAVGWWNVSQPLNLTVAPAPGYAFDRWVGWGPGSANGTGRTITIVPKGPLIEKARFVPGTEVDLEEFGLPSGTPWSVTVRGFTTPSTSDVAAVWEPPGTYGFHVSPVPGYRISPKDGAFSVNGSTALVQIRFLPVTPPGPTFPVAFHVEGLPNATTVPITVRDLTRTAGTADPSFRLINGSYAFRVGYVPGYHAALAAKTFFVQGGPLTVDVPFVRTVYPAAWEAFGTRYGMNWSVRIAGATWAANSSWVVAALPNGSYPYTVTLPANYSASPRTGVLVVNGFAPRVPLFFSLVEFPALFEAAGLAAASPWSVRLGNVTLGSASAISEFLAPNGTYTFDVHAPPGYYAVPSHGRLTVAGAGGPPTRVQFLLSSHQPSAALVAALRSGAISVSLWIGASVVVGFALRRGLRRRGD